jgi:hypothetical protein
MKRGRREVKDIWAAQLIQPNWSENDPSGSNSSRNEKRCIAQLLSEPHRDRIHTPHAGSFFTLN